MVGYSSTAEGETSPSNYRAHFTSLGSQKIYVIPFRFDSLGDYTLTSANLLLSTPLGLPSQPSFATPSLSDVSLQVFSSLPSSLSLPTPITSFASLDIATTTVGVHTFAATSSPTLTASTTYYLGLTYLGDDPLSWNYYEEVPSLGPKLSNPVSDTFNSRTAFIYYAIGSEGVTQDTAVLGGFSITAAAVNAIPEPATTVAFAAGAVLAAAMWVRWRRTARSRE